MKHLIRTLAACALLMGGFAHAQPINPGGGGGGGTVAAPSIVGYSLGGVGTVWPGSAYGGYVDESTSSQFHTDLAAAPNLNITGPGVAGWTGITPGGTAATTVYAGDTNTAAEGGKAVALGAGVATNIKRTTIAQDATTIAGAPPGRTYNTVAALQTSQSLTGGSGGATGDYLSHCVIVPGTTSPGNVIIYDNSTAIYTFAGGPSSVSTLISWPVPVGAVSASGAWKVTTGANVTVFCSGKFT